MKDKKIASFYEFTSVLISAVIAVAVIFTFFIKISSVNGASMNKTLLNGDRVIITARDNEVEYGDIVVISQPNGYNEVLIKRVIAVGGQTLDIDARTHTVTVDGVVLDEPYIAEPTRVLGTISYPVVVPEGYVFVMGDNRNNSGDSRFKDVGMIDERYIVGQAIYKIGDNKLLTMEK